MSQMVRKQIYIEKRQKAQLEQAAGAQGVSEGALIRQAIDQLLAVEGKRLPADTGAWAQAMDLMRALQAQGPLPNHRRTWQRDDLYAEGEARHGARG